MQLIIGVLIGFCLAVGLMYLNWYLEQKKKKNGTV